MTRFTADTLDLSRIGAPTLTEVDYDARLAARLLKFQELWDAQRAKDPSLPAFDLVTTDGRPLIETEPKIIAVEEAAYGDIHVLQAINDHGDALRLATATGADLDHIANTYMHTARLKLREATGGAEAVYEQDGEYRARAQISPEALPLFGITPGGYVWRVLLAFGDRVKGVRPRRRPGGWLDLFVLARGMGAGWSVGTPPVPGAVTLLPPAGDGTPAETLIGDIQGAFDGEDASQSTDIVTIYPARIVRSAVRVRIFIPRGPDPAPVAAAAAAAIAALATERHKLDEVLHTQAIGAVAKIGAVRHAVVEEPAGDLVGGVGGAPWVTSVTVVPEVES